MSGYRYFLPMRHVVLLAFDGVQALDITGPSSVFGAAAEEVAGSYRVTVASAEGGVARCSCGVGLATTPVADIAPQTVDLLLIAGGATPGLRALARDAAARDWSTAVATRAERYGSVCSGAFVLAAWGLADGRRVATHWRGVAELARRYPAVTVEPDALFVEDGPLWTSAGITTGIDMALAIVARDHGEALAAGIARRLVLHGRRAGHQSQFSALLEAQGVAALGGYARL
ncbi:MAG: AraC family transcriptional regulator, partial [Alphaproteobacteria bacterium]|nr:AraC family transcriptional regulator [Alphaproteobacteria bacterium]